MKAATRNRILSLLVVVAVLSSLHSCLRKPSSKEDQPTAATTLPTSSTENTTAADPYFDWYVRGKGSDFVGKVGYVVTYNKKGCTQESNWVIPTYVKDKQFYNESGTVPHKTEVRVVEQDLEHSTHSYYHGYLLVEDTTSKEQFYINVHNFTGIRYWEIADLETAARLGELIAEFNQSSDYYPVDYKNRKVEIPDGTHIIVVGLNGIRSKIDQNTHQIEALVFKEWSNGYGSGTVFFNVADLSIIY